MMVPIKLYKHNIPVIIDHFKKLSPEDRRMRFGHVATDYMIEKYVTNAFGDRDVWFGIIEDSNVIAATHVSVLDNGEAEFGLSIDKEFRGLGLGNQLFERALSACKVRGITGVFMQCLSENMIMRHMALNKKMRLVTRGGESEAHAELSYQPMAGAIEEVGWRNMILIDSMFRSSTAWYKWLK